MSRLGIRFVDRLVGDKMNNIEEYVRQGFFASITEKRGNAFFILSSNV